MAKHNTVLKENHQTTDETAAGTLIDLGDHDNGSARDINRMISGLEDELASLETQLKKSNQSIRKDIKKLHESDAAIGDQVADIYRQFSLVEGQFEDLKKGASTIRGRLTRLTNTLNGLREQAMTALADALENQGAVNQQLEQQQQQLEAQVTRLADRAQSLTRQLDKSIEDNTRALNGLEQRIVADLRQVARESEQRDQAADERLDQHQARMLQMQQVDQALDRRAEQLEALGRSLREDTGELQQQVEMLGVITERLAADIEALQLQTARLETDSRRHHGLIEQLQHSGRDLGERLLALGRREDRRFVTLSLLGLVLLLAVALLFGYGQFQRLEDSTLLDQRAIDTQNQIQDLQTRVLDEQLATRNFSQDIASLQQQVARVQETLATVNDQVASLDGRISYIAPFYGFGGDNVIHGSQWLAQLDPERFSIRLAEVKDKAEMFDLVQRYNHYLPLTLGYYPNAAGGYTLIYGGEFADAGEVEETLRWMPRYFGDQPAEAVPNREILAAITR